MRALQRFDAKDAGQQEEVLEPVGAIKGDHFTVQGNQVAILKPGLIFDPENVERNQYEYHNSVCSPYVTTMPLNIQI